MTEYISKTMDTRFWLLLLELIIKNNYLNNYSEKAFVKQIVLIFSVIRTAFLSSILILKNAKHLKKN